MSASFSGAASLLHTIEGSSYLWNAENRAVFLSGDHTWTNNISFSNTGQFNFGAYLDLLSSEGANLIRYWNWAGVTVNQPDAGTALIQPFQQNADGKWDLTQFNEAYFAHVAADVDAAAAKGIYVSVMAFFDYDPEGRYGWSSSVWNGNNNVNGTATSNIAVEESDPVTLALQQNYLAKLLDTLGHKQNVLWEIANEPHNSQATVSWENTLVDFIHQYQQSHGLLAQPVGITANFPEGNQEAINPMISATNADWTAPHGWLEYRGGSPADTGSMVQIVDTDHTFGMGGDGDWVWRQFTQGHGGVNIMDDMKGTGLPGTFDLGEDTQGFEMAERLALKEVHTVLGMVDIDTMKPHGELSSTGYMLADPAKGEFVALASHSGTVTLDLSEASGLSLDARWLDVATGDMSAVESLSGGNAHQGFTPAFGDAVLVITPSGGAPVIPPATEEPATGTSGGTLGNGVGNLVLHVSEDAYQGHAEFVIAVDGRQIGGTHTASASHAVGESQEIAVEGDFGAGTHAVSVTFLNDVYAGTGADRNLYVDSIGTGAGQHDGAALYWNGSASFDYAL